jgi:prepilin-type N-terminal cleavage/methylation domain-containing protein
MPINSMNMKQKGFTLVELMVTVSIIAILSSIIYASFDQARAQARDKARLSSLKEVQLALEVYRAQNGSYPIAGCGAASFAGPGPGSAGFSQCGDYIVGLVPDFIDRLPVDPRFENDSNRGFYYRSDGNSYKLMSYDVVEAQVIGAYGEEFARCPGAMGACGGAVPATTYAVYSAGAEDW